MSIAEPTSYDEVPYPSYPIRRTHPANIGAIARLFGVEAASPRAARVLEIGCASGGNLLPIAVAYPQARLVGIDASRRQIDDGRKVIEELGLKNLELRACDVRDLDSDVEPFDYIICHGVFSWVPPEVQTRILETCRRHLAPHGVAYVSYNAQPGWHLRTVVRDMMRYHVRNWKEPDQRITQARALLDFLVKTADGRTEAYRQMLKEEAELIRVREDSYLFHEHLEEHNQAFYLHEFVAQAERAGLQYLGDSEFSSMLAGEFGPEVTELLEDAPLVVHEQYLDFLRSRSFRCTLLCHRELTIRRRINAGVLQDSHITLDQPLEIDQLPGSPDEPLICRAQGETLTARAPVTQAALLALHEIWPDAPTLEELEAAAWRGAREKLSVVPVDEADWRRTLHDDLLTLYSRRLVRLLRDPPRCATRASDFPKASPLVRYQAERHTSASTVRHEQMRLSDIHRWLLPRLDGQTSRSALAASLAEALRSRELTVKRDGEPVTDVDDTLVEQVLDASFQSLANMGLLIG
ncbi:MAG TPA: class I SAM-dependent methyltransferase [Pirellulaceae bacterium]|nr:class I SAM-dependent methyltransferase [Pirellulaceae bacterium]